MNAFQALALVALAMVLLRDVRLFRHGRLRRLALLGHLTVLATAAVGILWPGATQVAAEALGIGRGADVVLYLSVLALLAISFYFHARTADLQRQVTELVRQLALRDVRRGGSESAAEGGGR